MRRRRSWERDKQLGAFQAVRKGVAASARQVAHQKMEGALAITHPPVLNLTKTRLADNRDKFVDPCRRISIPRDAYLLTLNWNSTTR